MITKIEPVETLIIKNKTFNFFILNSQTVQIQIIEIKNNCTRYDNIYYYCGLDKAIEYIKKYN